MHRVRASGIKLGEEAPTAIDTSVWTSDISASVVQHTKECRRKVYGEDAPEVNTPS